MSSFEFKGMLTYAIAGAVIGGGYGFVQDFTGASTTLTQKFSGPVMDGLYGAAFAAGAYALSTLIINRFL